jgi:lysozyme family protein
MSEKFDKSLKFIISSETVFKKGHYGDLNFAVSTNNPKDRGGLTKFGIDKRSHPDEDIENLTYDRAVQIYKEEYWDKGKCDDMEWPLCLVHMDGVVNTGIGQQTKFLQRVCGTKDDGGYGPNTKKAMLAACEKKGALAVSLEIIEMREAFYHKIVEVNPDNEEFINGWLNRLEKLKKAVSA